MPHDTRVDTDKTTGHIGSQEALVARGRNREELLDRGGDLLYSKGYDAAGVAEITAAAGVPKGSFYNYFESKQQFALAVLKRYVDAAVEGMRSILVEGDGPYLSRLQRIYEMWGDEQAGHGFTRGCLMGNLCQELAGREPVFREAIDTLLGRMRHEVEAALGRAQEAGELKPDLDVEPLAAFIGDAWQGALMRAKAERSGEPLAGFLAAVFEGLLS